MAEQEKVISIRVRTETNERKLGQLESSIVRVQKARAELIKQSKTHAGLNAKEEAELGRLSNLQQKLAGRQTEVKKTLKALNKEQKTAINSYDSLTARNAKLSKELRALGDPLGKNKVKFQQLSSEIKKNTGTLSEMDEAQGRFQRNVGNYPDLLGKISPALGGVITGLKGMVTASLAFIATPLGAILAAIVALAAPIVSFFKNTQEGMELLNKATAGVSAAIDVLVDRFSLVGEAFVDILSGKWSEGVDKLGKSFEGVTDEIIKETKAAVKLQEQLDQLAKDEATNTAKTALLRQKIVKLRVEAAEQEEINAGKSAKLVREAIELEKQLAEEEESIQLRQFANLLALEDEEAARVRLMQLKNEGKQLTIEELGLANSTVEDLQEANDLLAEIINTETSFFQAKRKFTKELNTLDKKAAQQRVKTQKDSYVRDVENYTKAEKNKSDITVEANAEEAPKAQSYAEYYKRLGFHYEEDAAAQKLKDEDKKTSVETGLILAQQASSTLAAISSTQINKELQELNRKKDEGLVTEADYQNQLNKIKEKEFNRNKAFALVDIAINTAKAVTALLATPPLAIAAGIAGGVQAGLVASQQYQPVKFAEGGLLQGNSHANGGIPMTINGQSGYEAEGGEAIINKRSTSMFAPLLSAINEAGGGVAFSSGAKPTMFAQGGLTPNISSSGGGMNQLFKLMSNRIDNIKVTNVASDTVNVSNRVQNIQSDASFG